MSFGTLSKLFLNNKLTNMKNVILPVMVTAVSAVSSNAAITISSGSGGVVNITLPPPNVSIHSSISAPVRQTPSPAANTLRVPVPESNTPRPSRNKARQYSQSYSSSYSSKDSVPSAKGSTPLAMPDMDDSIQWYVSGGYQSDYVYHGVSQIQNALSLTSPGYGDELPMAYFGVGMTYKGFAAGIKYVRSLDTDLVAKFDPAGKSSVYEEYVVDFNYTYAVLDDAWLDVTAGYQGLIFQDELFWNTDMQHKFYVKAAMNKYQWARPSIAFYHFTQAEALETGTTQPGQEILDGNQIILQVDGSGTIYDGGFYNVGVGYYAQLGLDDGYNEASNSYDIGWYEAGISVPITFINGVSVIPNIHYTATESDTLEDPGFWYGLKVNYNF